MTTEAGMLAQEISFHAERLCDAVGGVQSCITSLREPPGVDEIALAIFKDAAARAITTARNPPTGEMFAWLATHAHGAAMIYLDTLEQMKRARRFAGEEGVPATTGKPCP